MFCPVIKRSAKAVETYPIEAVVAEAITGLTATINYGCLCEAKKGTNGDYGRINLVKPNVGFVHVAKEPVSMAEKPREAIKIGDVPVASDMWFLSPGRVSTCLKERLVIQDDIRKVEWRIAKKRHDNVEIEVVPVLVNDPGKGECTWLMALQRVPPGEKSWAEVLHDFQQHDRALTPIRDGIKAVVKRVWKRRKRRLTGL